MKNIDIITACQKAKEALKNNMNGNAAEIINALQEAAEMDQRAEKAKTNGKKSIYAAAMRILKNSAAYNQTRPALHYSYNDGQRVTICDGFQMIQFNAETAPELPALPADMEYINAARLIDPAAENTDAVTLPNINDLKNYIKIEKAKQKATKNKDGILFKLITNNQNIIFVNAEYLRNVLKCLPGAVARAHANRPLNCIYFENDNGRGLLMPIRK